MFQKLALGALLSVQGASEVNDHGSMFLDPSFHLAMAA